jgi:hypothetical protein
MPQYELNPGLAEFCHEKGGPGTNPHGVQGSPALRRWRRIFRDELQFIADEECSLHQHEEPVTHAECLARTLWHLALGGERWAAHLLLLRWQGRVPYNIDLQQQVQISFTEDQRERYFSLIQREASGEITSDEASELHAFRLRSHAPQPQLSGGSDNGSGSRLVE